MTDTISPEAQSRDPVLLKKSKDLESMLLKLASLGDMIAGKKQLVAELQAKLKALQQASLTDDHFESELDNIYQLLNEATSSVKSLTQVQLDEISKYKSPPERIKVALEAIMYLLHGKTFTWDQIKTEMAKGNFIQNVLKFNLAKVPLKIVNHVKTEYVQKGNWDIERLKKASKAMGPMGEWLQSQIMLAEIYEKKPEAKEIMERKVAEGQVKQDIAQNQEELEFLQSQKNQLETQIESTRKEIEAMKAGENQRSMKKSLIVVNESSNKLITSFQNFPDVPVKSEKKLMSSKLIQTEEEIRPAIELPQTKQEQPRVLPTLAINSFALFLNRHSEEPPKPLEVKRVSTFKDNPNESISLLFNKKAEEPLKKITPISAPKLISSFTIISNVKVQEPPKDNETKKTSKREFAEKSLDSFKILFNARKELPLQTIKPLVKKSLTSYSLIYNQHVDPQPSAPEIITVEVAAPKPQVASSEVQTDSSLTTSKLSNKNIQTEKMAFANNFSSKNVQTNFLAQSSKNLQTESPLPAPKSQTSFSFIYSPHVEQPPIPPQIKTVYVPAPKPETMNCFIQTDAIPGTKTSSINTQTEVLPAISRSSKNVQTNSIANSSVMLQTEELVTNEKSKGEFEEMTHSFGKKKAAKVEAVFEANSRERVSRVQNDFGIQTDPADFQKEAFQPDIPLPDLFPSDESKEQQAILTRKVQNEPDVPLKSTASQIFIDLKLPPKIRSTQVYYQKIYYEPSQIVSKDLDIPLASLNNSKQGPVFAQGQVKRVSNVQALPVLSESTTKRFSAIKVIQPDRTIGFYNSAKERQSQKLEKEESSKKQIPPLPINFEQKSSAKIIKQSPEINNNTIVHIQSKIPLQNTTENNFRVVSKTPEPIQRNRSSLNPNQQVTRISKIITLPVEREVQISRRSYYSGPNAQTVVNSHSIDVVPRKFSIVKQSAPAEISAKQNLHPMSKADIEAIGLLGHKEIVWENWRFDETKVQSNQSAQRKVQSSENQNMLFYSENAHEKFQNSNLIDNKGDGLQIIFESSSPSFAKLEIQKILAQKKDQTANTGSMKTGAIFQNVNKSYNLKNIDSKGF